MDHLSRLALAGLLALSGLSAHAAGSFQRAQGLGTDTWWWDQSGQMHGSEKVGWVPTTVAPGSSPPTITAKQPVSIKNKDVVIDVQGKVIDKTKFAGAALKFGKMLPVIGGAIQLAEMLDYMKDVLGSADPVTLKKNGDQIEADVLIKNIQEIDSKEYTFDTTGKTGWAGSLDAACQFVLPGNPDVSKRYIQMSYVYPSGLRCFADLKRWNPDTRSYTEQARYWGPFFHIDRNIGCPPGALILPSGACRIETASTQTLTEQQISDKIAQSSGWPTSAANLVKKMLDTPNFNDIPVDKSSIVTSGPSSIPGETKTTTESVRLQPGTNIEAPPSATTATDPGTKTITSSETTKLVYQGDTVSYTTTNSNTVTNITNNTTNTTTTVNNKTEVTENKEPPIDFCKDHPESIACAKMDEVEPETINDETRNISITPTTGWGSDNMPCPAPRHLTLKTGGLPVEITYQPICDFAAGIRPLVIAFAWVLAAGMVIAVGRRSN